MHQNVVVDGRLRWFRSPEAREQRRRIRSAIRDRHQEELRDSGLVQRLVLRWRIAREVRQELRKLEPSPESLFVAPFISIAGSLHPSVTPDEEPQRLAP